jgi:transcriptional regulator with XRE-family HTH domain
MREAPARTTHRAVTGGPAAFAARLRRLRLDAGLTQEALAERAGLGVRTVRALEEAEGWPLRGTAQRLAQALGLAAAAAAAFVAGGRPPARPRRRAAWRAGHPGRYGGPGGPTTCPRS